MKNLLGDRLLRREIAADRKRYSSIPGLYGDRRWVQDLDIVNELEGHSGCVNALSWSTSGRFLASGSDDHNVNIHSYHSESSTSQFNLTTSIKTGHESNIFSVKFMPYSNDRTIVSATDDVRIFDIEYSGHSALGSSSSRKPAGSRRPIGVYGIPDGLTLTQQDTNAKAFRSHTDTVKRIVTEDNPFFFLTCSEDGDVRQWDVRQPAKTYPRHRETWGYSSRHDLPPPLISYSKYHLDLNAVSCSPSQPHYIALGGAHLHCFLHDRRMLGRDVLEERGAKLASTGDWTEHDDGALGNATRCVKKFAPNGQQIMGRRDSGHITACKISDANPNELVVSWSGDHIYSFDILRSPDVAEKTFESQNATGTSGKRVKETVRKRKRPESNIVSSGDVERTGSRQRTESSDEALALRVNYGNGQSEEIRIEAPETPESSGKVAIAQDTTCYRIARCVVKLLDEVFYLADLQIEHNDTSLSKLSPNFTSILGLAASVLPDMDEMARAWRYPVDPTPFDVALQNRLRGQRATARRFVQATGTLARVLGGQLKSSGDANLTISQYFATIQLAPNERSLAQHEQFGYDFLKAILLWLDSGLGALVEGFSSHSSSDRFPIPPEADTDAIDELLIPYLVSLASDMPIVDVDASRFETDDTRILFPSERSAVVAFARTLKVPFADLSGTDTSRPNETIVPDYAQDRADAVTRWALKTGRGILLNASRSIRFSAVDQAYGGRGIADPEIQQQERAHRVRQADIDPVDNDEAANDESNAGLGIPGPSMPVEEEISENEDDEDSDADKEPNEAEDDEDEDEIDENGLTATRSGRVLWRSDFDRSYYRERVESRVPCTPHTRTYSGHCNVRTVKDVNFFGQQDEYVVSGSDCGHLFIWDRKTTQLINILEGDGEVVNVIQGHPYEPTLAVSGIDHTIKIFSPDARDQYNARHGIGVRSTDPGLSSLEFGRSRRARQRTQAESPPFPRTSGISDEDHEQPAANGLRSRKAMHEVYEITAQNDTDRQGGREDAFITRALLSQLASTLRANQAQPDGDDNTVGPIIFNNEDGCVSM